MAVTNQELPTLLDMAKRRNPDGTEAQLIEMATRRNVFLKHMVWKEANNFTGHRVSSRYALPNVYYRKFNEGVPASKSHARQFDETCGMMEAKSKVDRDLMRLNGGMAYRASEDKAFFAAMNNEFEKNVAYASTATAPEKFHGLIPRLDSTTGEAGSQVILAEANDAGNDYTSMLLVGWGPQSVYGIYPKGSKEGIETLDLGELLVDDGSAERREFLAMVTLFKWHHGIAVEDWRYISRIANIDTGSLLGTDDTLVPLMIDAIEKLESLDGIRPVFYVNRRIYTTLWKQSRSATKNSTLQSGEIEGKPVVTIAGIPIERTDAITNTEGGIS